MTADGAFVGVWQGLDRFGLYTANMALPTSSTPGYAAFKRNNRTFVGCACEIAFLEAGEKLGLALGLIKSNVDPIQLVGGAEASGGTHLWGGAFDVAQLSPDWVHKVWRPMGAAFWPRIDDHPGVPGDLWDQNTHGHGVIDCQHSARTAGYQITAYWNGYSGLGKATSGPFAGQWGYGSKDPDPWRPSVRRSWRDGIAWANSEVARLTAKTASAAPQEDIDMAQQVTIPGGRPDIWNPVVVPNDGKRYRVSLAFAGGAQSRKVEVLIFGRVASVKTPSKMARNYSFDWQRDVPGDITLEKGEGALSIRWDGTVDQALAVSVYPVGTL